MTDIKVEDFLSEISADSPCGENLEYDPDYLRLERDLEGTPERQIGDSIIPAEEPDWKKIRDQALSLLERSRDIQVSIYLTCALVHTDGFAGLDQGLSLISGLLQKFWEQVYPQQDPDDEYPVLRMNALTRLNDYSSIIGPLNHIPLSQSQMGSFSWRDIEISEGKVDAVADEAEPPEKSVIDAAFLDTGLEVLQSLDKTIQHALQEVQNIEAISTEKAGAVNAPELSTLIDLLKHLDHYLTEQMQLRQGEEGAGKGAAGVPGAGSAAAPGEAFKVGVVNSREDVVRAIDAICKYFARYEPSSPVPLLLQRAKKLLSMNFMEILQDLTPDAVSQAEKICGSQKDDE